jgi:hypothetical protein
MSELAVVLKPIKFGWAVTLTDGRELARFTGFGGQGSRPVLYGGLQDLKAGPFRPLSSLGPAACRDSKASCWCPVARAPEQPQEE